MISIKFPSCSDTLASIAETGSLPQLNRKDP